MFKSSSIGGSGLIENLETRVLLSASLPDGSFLDELSKVPAHVVSTVPANGDVNPYGVAIVPQNFQSGGKIHGGDVLVSNFNASSNLQGTGTTIVSIDPSGHQSLFFHGKNGLGLTTALGVLPGGFVLVGNVPAPDGANVQGPGSLLIIDKNGHLVKTLVDPNLLNGPWDMAVDANADDGNNADVFVSNVLDGTITRLKVKTSAKSDTVQILSKTRIGSDYAWDVSPTALLVGPTGLAFDENKDILYVASTDGNNIFALSHAETTGTRSGRGKLIFHDDSLLRGPVGLAIAPNGNLLASNGDAINTDAANKHNSEIIEFTTTGKFVDRLQINPTAGGAFGLAVEVVGDDATFAAVNDITNELEIWKVEL